MADKTKVSRRRFMTGVAAGATALPSSQAVSSSGKTGPLSTSAPAEISYPRKFTGRHLQEISFPLGGVGAGSVGLGGRGQLRDWQIFNRADKGYSLRYAFPAVYVQSGSRKPLARVLEARFEPPYQGASGLGYENAPGLPRLASATFTGEFPIARIDFHDAELPVEISLEAFTPFIPLDADSSGLPVAVLRYRVANSGREKSKVSIAFSIDNPVGREGRSSEYRSGASLSGLFMSNPFAAATDPLAGSFAVCVIEPGDGEVTYVRGWPHARWPWTGALLFWDDFSSDGALGPEAPLRDTVGSVCLSREIAPKAESVYTFLLAWHFPNRTPERCGWSAPKGEEKTVIGNHYCTRFGNAWKAAESAASGLPGLEHRTRRFVTAMRETTLPSAVRDAAVSNLSTLASPTCFRTADGAFHGFEGCNDHGGCCFGNCTHVWNYEAATAFVFPCLSRSARESSFGPCMHDNGLMDFRQLLPAGKGHWTHAAADGQMGQIMKLYLDWRQSGDTDWLHGLWPAAKRALEFAWIPGGWDGNRDGVMEGVQHNTYDVEFYGPNPLCGIWYLGALRAAEQMAHAVGDSEFAGECRRLFENGSKWVDTNLFNGEFYIQKVRGIPKDQIAEGLLIGMGAADTEHPDYQLGDGCLVDQLVGQYMAHVAGLGLLLEQDHVRKALRSIYRYNYKHNLYHHEAVQRVFALNDEAGLVICDYGAGERPRIPFPYFAELMTGFEYSAAILMLQEGMISEGVELIGNIRRRYDGERRNPWDEAECGHHYARAMASWAAIPALSGFRYHGVEKSIVAVPKVNEAKFSSFWSAATGWGTFSREIQRARIRFALNLVEGSLALRSVQLKRGTSAGASAVRLGKVALPHTVRNEGSHAIVAFAEEVRLKEGDRLLVTL